MLPTKSNQYTQNSCSNGSRTLERLPSNSCSTSRTLERIPSSKLNPSTPDKLIISNTLERIRGNVSNSTTPKDPRKLMIGPPSSLCGLNDEEKKELINEIERKNKKQKASTSDYFQVNNNDRLFRRKSASESEMFSSFKVPNQPTIHALISSNLTQSLRSEYRKPPTPQRMYSVPKNIPSEMSSSSTIFQGIKKPHRRKSEAPTFSPKTSLKELFFKGNTKKKKKDNTPPSSTRFYVNPVRPTNEIVKFGTSSASSELSLDSKSGRVEGWAQSLEKLLADAVGLRCFHEFLKKEFSEENLLFWVACEHFKRMRDVSQMKEKAQEITRNYLNENAPLLVNVDSIAVKRTESELNAPLSDMFNVPQQQVFQLMKFDSYNRFLKSSLFQECLGAENSDRLLPFEEEVDAELRKNPLWVKSLTKYPIIESNEKRKNPLNFLTRDKKLKSPDAEKARKARSSSLGAYDECNRKNMIYPVGELNGHAPNSNENQMWYGTQSSKSRILRVILPDGTSGVIVGEKGQTLRDGLKELADQKNLLLTSVDITIGYEKKNANLDLDISELQENIVYLERRVFLRFDLPNGRSVGVKSSPSKRLQEVLQPIMKTNGFDLEHYSVLLINTKTPLSLDSFISSVENKRLVTKLNFRKLDRQNFDNTTGKMRAPGVREPFQKFRTNNINYTDEKDEKSESRKITRKKSDDGAAALMSVLQKSQNSRLDDQRGMISLDIEMPDFLKRTSRTPPPIRNKNIDCINDDVFQSSPLRTVRQHQYPGSPFIVDKNLKDITEKLDLSLNLNSTKPPSLCSVRSWKALPTPDRELVDRSYLLDPSYALDRVCTSTESINALSPSVNTKVDVLELSKSEPTLMTIDSLINTSSSSTEAICSPGTSQKYISSGLGEQALVDKDMEVTYVTRDRSVSCDGNYKRNRRKKDLDKYNIHSHEGGRPLPINKFNESDILRYLDEDLVATPEKKYCDKNIEDLQDRRVHVNHTNSDDNIDIMNTDADSKERSAAKFGLTLETPSSERIESVDIVDYNLSPCTFECYRKLSLTDDLFRNSNHVFEANAIPTPEKDKLLNGETIRGRQKEKITLV